MREWELRVGRECLTLDFAKYWFSLLGYMDVAYGINYILFYQLHIVKVRSVLRPLGWYIKGLPWNSILSGLPILTALFCRIEILWR